jgi:1-phosphatidylinositol phosphodiesterase
MLTLPLTLVLLLAPSILADPLPRELVRRADASYRTLSTASNPDWMLKVPDATSLASISIPGTHESMALFGGDLTECQGASLSPPSSSH